MEQPPEDHQENQPAHRYNMKPVPPRRSPSCHGVIASQVDRFAQVFAAVRGTVSTVIDLENQSILIKPPTLYISEVQNTVSIFPKQNVLLIPKIGDASMHHQC
jgi:hypothetical protein